MEGGRGRISGIKNNIWHGQEGAFVIKLLREAQHNRRVNGSETVIESKERGW